MKILGLIGGTSWVSTVDYYRYINLGINERLGWIDYSHCILHSFSYGDIKRLADAGKQREILDLFIKACLNMKDGGAEAIVLCANTMHMFAEDLEQATGLPVIHIAEATASAIVEQGLGRVALLGTKPTMELDFYTTRLKAKGISTLIPNDEDREYIHATIFEELGKGVFTDGTRARYLSIINDLVSQGAQGVILGCTEIPMLLSPEDIAVPSFDTTKLHSAAAVAFSLG